MNGHILLRAALLQFVLLVVSIVTSTFFLREHNMTIQVLPLLIALVLLGIAAVGIYQIRTPQKTTPVLPHISIPLGFSLGILFAILLYIPALGVLLSWGALGLPMLLQLLLQHPSAISSISPLLALSSVALYAIFAIRYSLSISQVTRRGGSVRQGIASCIQEAMATFLGTTLTFSLIDIIAHVFFHTGSELVGPSSWTSVSPLVNALSSYQGTVQMIATWLFTSAMVGLIFALIGSFILRRRTSLPQPERVIN